MMLKRYLLLLVFGAGSLCSAARHPVAEIQAAGGQQSDQKSNESRKDTSPKLGKRDSTREKSERTGARDSTRSTHKAAKHHKGGKKSKKSSSESTPVPK